MCFKKETYFGLKLHALVTTNSFITDFLLTASNIDDRDAVFELLQTNAFIKILADKGYISNELKASLAKEKNVLLLSLKRKNSKTPLDKRLQNVLSKAHWRVETSFSQLAEQFNNNLVFYNRYGKYINSRKLRQCFKDILKENNLEIIKFHDLRHTYATRLFELGEKEKTVQKLMGHSNIAVTMNTYTHVLDDIKEKAASKLDGLAEMMETV